MHNKYQYLIGIAIMILVGQAPWQHHRCCVNNIFLCKMGALIMMCDLYQILLFRYVSKSEMHIVNKNHNPTCHLQLSLEEFNIFCSWIHKQQDQLSFEHSVWIFIAFVSPFWFQNLKETIFTTHNCSLDEPILKQIVC